MSFRKQLMKLNIHLTLTHMKKKFTSIQTNQQAPPSYAHFLYTFSPQTLSIKTSTTFKS